MCVCVCVCVCVCARARARACVHACSFLFHFDVVGVGGWVALLKAV